MCCRYAGPDKGRRSGARRQQVCGCRARSEPLCRRRAEAPLMSILQGPVRMPDRRRWRMLRSAHCLELTQYCIGANKYAHTDHYSRA
mgnify:CR=1 FL=1